MITKSTEIHVIDDTCMGLTAILTFKMRQLEVTESLQSETGPAFPNPAVLCVVRLPAWIFTKAT